MSNDYRIEKIHCAVTVTTRIGELLTGDLFLQPYSQRRSGPEEPADMLNEPEPFFPLELEDGSTVLLAKRLLLEVQVPEVEEASGQDPLLGTGVRYSPVEVTLVDGSTRRGTVRLELPYERPRLLDFLNRFRQQFVTLYTEDGVRLVNHAYIERVQPLD